MSLRISNTRAYPYQSNFSVAFSEVPEGFEALPMFPKASGNVVNFQERVMNEDRVQGNWLEFKGKVKEQWGKLTDDDLDVIAGKRDQMIGKLQQRHGLTHEEAHEQLDDWHRKNPTSFFERY